MKKIVALDKPGKRVLLMGNEAIARGAIEAGTHYAAAYPGTPSSEIMMTLAPVAKELEIYAEWSTNEKVALEGAAAASLAGLRGLAIMKHAGVNWASDFLLNINLSGIGKGGLVLVSADDPGGHSSTNEQDNRFYGQFAEIPTIEPSDQQEAKEMIKYAFELSELVDLPVFFRTVTRISHSRSDVVLGEIEKIKRKPEFDKTKLYSSFPPSPGRHNILHEKVEKTREIFEKSELNKYDGVGDEEFRIITCGTGYLYSKEALEMLGLEKIGILRLGTLYPLPEKLIKKHLSKAKRILFVEEVDPYLEENIRSIAIDLEKDEIPEFFGKRTGHIPKVHELNTDIIINAITKIMNIDYEARDLDFAIQAEKALELVPPRTLTLCPGCPHRASFYAVSLALRKNKKGFCMGDIGCNALGILPPFRINKTLHCMGSGAGVAGGFGQLDELEDPPIAFMGDSTFFHAGMPAIINIAYNRSNATVIILDNMTTAMTGFQSHPGTGISATGDPVTKLNIEDLLKGAGIKDVRIIDPYNIEEARKAVYDAINNDEITAIIFRHMCAIEETRLKRKRGIEFKRYWVDPEKCIGCKICTDQFACAALVWEREEEKTKIDEVLCIGCGVCADVCPQQAISEVK